MADQKISELTALTGANVADDDAIAIVDTSATETKKIVFSELKNALDTATGFVRITGDTMTGALDVQSTITADGLTVDGDTTINAALPNLYLTESDSTDLNTRIALQAGVQYLASVNDALTVTKNRISWDNSTGDISFYEATGTTPKFFWDASDQELEVTSTGVHGIHLRQQDDNNSNSSRLFFDNSTNIWTAYSTVGSFKIASGATIGTSSGTDRFVIDSSGNVGIGTSSPSANLEIAQSGNNVGLLVSGGGYNYTAKFESSDAEANIIIEDSNSTNDGNRIGVATNDMYFITDNSERMRIDSSGNLLIGQTDSNARLASTSTTNKQLSLRYTGVASYYTSVDSSGNYIIDKDGTERMRIDSNGNVGIGTNSPFDVFHVRVGTDKNLYFTDASSETGNVATIQGINNAGSSLASVGFRGTDIRFANQSSETMRIDNSGNVGIGTSSPTGKLSIASGTYNAATPLATADDIVISGNQSLGMSFITASAGSSNQTIVFGDSDNTDIGMIRYAHANNSMQFTTNTTEAMRIDSSGRVGIGTTSPSGYRLHVEAVSGGNGLKITRGAGSQFNIFQSVDGISHVGSSGSNAALTFRTGTTVGSDTERMRIDSSGNVGIGSAPSHKLHVEGAGTQFIFLNNASTNDGFYFKAGSGASSIQTNGGSSVMNFFTAGTERMRIDSSGNLLVGHTAEGTWDANNSAILRASGVATFTSTSTPPLYANLLTSDGDIVSFRKDGAPVGIIGTIGGDTITIGSGDTGLLMNQTNDEIIPWNTSTNAARDGFIDLGDASHRFKDLHLSGTAYVGLSSVISAGDQGIQVDGGNGIIYIGRGSTSVSTHISFLNPNGEVGKITTTGSSTSYVTSSDYRLKENVVNLTSATTRLKQLEPKRFNFIADADTTVDGFFAHEVQSVVPEAVTGAKDAMRDEEYEVTPAVLDDDGNVVTEAVMGTRSVPDYQGIDQSKLVPLLVATIKELEARITALENA